MMSSIVQLFTCWAFLLSFFPSTYAMICKEQEVVADFDLGDYQGQWYEIANTIIQRMSFQKNCQCTTATYTLATDSESVVVNNTCLNSQTNEYETTLGSATMPAGTDV
eukprot:Awhi_evm1s662